MKTVAVLDTDNRLIGRRAVADDQPGVDPGDLPADGSYFYDQNRGAFFPLGYGVPARVSTPPCSLDLVVAGLVRRLGADAPVELQEWLKWYDANGRVRDQNRSEYRRLAKKRL